MIILYSFGNHWDLPPGPSFGKIMEWNFHWLFLPPWAKHTFRFGCLSRTPPNIIQQIAWAVSPGIPTTRNFFITLSWFKTLTTNVGLQMHTKNSSGLKIRKAYQQAMAASTWTSFLLIPYPKGEQKLHNPTPLQPDRTSYIM